MKIIADKEGQNIIGQLLDIALKQGGLANLEAVNRVRNIIEEYIEKDEIH